MTREERENAIKWFEMLKESFVNTEYEVYLTAAIEALQQKPCEIHLTCTDEEIAKSFIEDVEAVKDQLEQMNELPPVTPQPKVGHWIENAPEYQNIDPPYICSECGNLHLRKTNYCDQCGCRMVEQQESEEA